MITNKNTTPAGDQSAASQPVSAQTAPVTSQKALGEDLYDAVCNRKEQKVRELLKKTTAEDVNWQNKKDGYTALTKASMDRHTEIVQMLLADPNIDVNLQNMDAETALICASWGGHTDIARLLLAHPNIDVNIQDKRGYTALIVASMQGHTEIVQMLLAHPNIDVNIQHKDGHTALIWASNNGRTEIVQMLLAHPNIDVNKQDEADGYTALICASFYGYTEIVQMLLAHPNIDVNIHNKNVRTAADLSHKYPHIVKMIEAHLNKKNITPAEDKSAISQPASPPTAPVKSVTSQKALGKDLYTAVIYKEEDRIQVLLQKATAEYVNWHSEDGFTALTYASSDGRTKIVRMLLAHPNIDVNLQDENGYTALTWASREGYTEIVQMLLAHPNIDVNLQVKSGYTGYTALTWASMYGKTEIVQMLLAHPNIDVNIQNKNGLTAADFARQYPHIVEMITAHLNKKNITPGKDKVTNVKITIATPAPPTSPHLSWLAVRLLESGVDAQLVKDCELKLVVQEGFVSEADFAETLPSEIDSAYLNRIGIVGKGLQVKLMRLHKELYTQYAPESSTPPPPPPPVLVEVTSNNQHPPEATWAFTCGATPIEDVQPLVTDAIALHGATSSRLLLRGRFSGTVTNLNRVYTEDYSCVIKCAGQEAVSATDSDGARGIDREFKMYAHVEELARLKGGKTITGCISCYHMHPAAHYLVLESFGQDIRCLLVRNFKLAPQLAEAIIAAVATFHSLGIVHCDIKPHNILFELDSSHSYVVKLCDLDGAHKAGEVCAASALGTKLYEAPEVYFASRAGEKVTAALSMDIFSLGIVLWQVLSRSPYPPMSVEQLHKCYSDQDELYLHLALSESTSMYQSLLYSCVKLKPPQERITSGALYQRVRDIAVSKAHPAWHRAQQENEFLKEKVSDKLDGLDRKLDTVLEVMKVRFDALGGEVVGMAEVLRREILLGHEGHSRVLASMKEATQDVLELLSDAQEAANTSSAEHTDQILSCIHHLQSRMDHNFAADISSGYTSSSNTEGLEGLLRGVSEELHARFNSLSSQLQEQVQQQSTAGADSARARAEALEMNHALSASLQQALKGIASVQSEVYMLRQGQEQLGVQVGRVLQDNKRLDTMLRTLLAGTHNIPTYAIILPVVAKTWLKKADPMRLVRNKYRLYFLCSHTHQIAPCGPKGEGYKITVTKQWVRDAAPVLMAALVMLKLALMAGGIPLPIPDLSSLLTSSALHVKFLDAALHLVQNPPEDHGAAEFAMDKSISLLGSVGTEEVMEDIGRRRVSLEEGSLKAYATIQSVLTTDSIDIALSSGLRQVVHPVTGRTAWVLDNDSVVEQYYMSA